MTNKFTNNHIVSSRSRNLIDARDNTVTNLFINTIIKYYNYNHEIVETTFKR